MSEQTRRHLPVSEKVAAVKRHLLEGTPVSQLCDELGINIGERLCWGFLEAGRAEKHMDGQGVFRKVKYGWRWHDLNGEQLTKDRLSGALTKLAAYRGTSCGVDVAQYVIRRINGQKTPEVERASVALEEMKAAVLGMMRLLGPKDFELLVDLVTPPAGWLPADPLRNLVRVVMREERHP